MLQCQQHLFHAFANLWWLESTSIFCTNDVMWHRLWCHLQSLPYQFSVFKDMGGWQPGQFLYFEHQLPVILSVINKIYFGTCAFSFDTNENYSFDFKVWLTIDFTVTVIIIIFIIFNIHHVDLCICFYSFLATNKTELTELKFHRPNAIVFYTKLEWTGNQLENTMKEQLVVTIRWYLSDINFEDVEIKFFAATWILASSSLRPAVDRSRCSSSSSASKSIPVIFSQLSGYISFTIS